MNNSTRLITLIILVTTSSCNYYKDYQFKKELLKCCSKPDSATINLFDFKNIDEYDDYQYAHITNTSEADIFIEYDNYSFGVYPGIGLKSNAICNIESGENKIIRFGFSSNGKQLLYRGEKINYSDGKDIVIERLEDNTNIYCLPTIEIKFKDKIDKDFTIKCVKSMNDGFTQVLLNGKKRGYCINSFLDSYLCEEIKYCNIRYVVERSDAYLKNEDGNFILESEYFH